MAARHAEVFFPDLAFCTDNGAMIALVGALRLATGAPRGDYAFSVRPRWELASLGVRALKRQRPMLRSEPAKSFRMLLRWRQMSSPAMGTITHASAVLPNT